jgi:hypothetical protein
LAEKREGNDTVISMRKSMCFVLGCVYRSVGI